MASIRALDFNVTEKYHSTTHLMDDISNSCDRFHISFQRFLIQWCGVGIPALWWDYRLDIPLSIQRVMLFSAVMILWHAIIKSTLNGEKRLCSQIQHCLGHFLFIEHPLKLNITLEINLGSKIRKNYLRNRCGRIWKDVNLVLLLLLSAKLRLFMGSYLLVEPYCTANQSNYPHKYGPH